MSGALLASVLDGVNPRIITIVTLAVSVAGLGVAFATGRKTRRVRQVLDLVRISIQTTGVVIVSVVSGVTGSPMLTVLAGAAGLLLGVVQGAHLAVSVEDGRIMARRSLLAFALWGGGLVLMQVAAAASRSGVFEVGRALSWFSIGTAVGTIAGRAPRLQAAATTAALVLTVAGTGLVAAVAVSTSIAAPAAAASCSGGPPGWTVTDTEPCTWSDGDVNAVLTEYSAVCGAELDQEWERAGGAPGQTVHVRKDEPQQYDDGKTWFQRHLVLSDRGIVVIASRNYSGGVAEQFVDTARTYAAANFSACSGSVAPPAGGDDTSATTAQAPATPRTSVIVEELDTDPPDVVAIPDEGAALTSTTIPPPTTTQAADATEGASDGATGEGVAAPPTRPASASDPITASEARDAQIAAAIAAALMGLISWAEALDRVGAALGPSARPGEAERIIDDVRERFDAETGDAIDPSDPANDVFRQPGTGELTISDGTMGAPAGHVWDPWSGRWLSPDEAQRVRDLATGPMRDHEGTPLRRSLGHDTFPDGSPVPPGWVWIDDGSGPRWVPPDEVDRINREATADAGRQRDMDEAWDRESAANAAEADARNQRLREERLAAEREEAAARLERDAAARQRIQNIADTAGAHGWNDILDRLDNIYDDDGALREDYLEDLARLTSNRLKAEAALFALPESMVADFATNTLRDMRDSTALRLLSGIASGGASEIAYQGADLADAILADIDAAIARGEDASRFGPLQRAAEVFARNNLPINTLEAVQQGASSPAELFGALLNDAMAAGDVAGAGRGGRFVGRSGFQDSVDAAADAAAARARQAGADLADGIAGPGAADAMRQAADEAAEAAADTLYRAEHGLGINQRPGLRDEIPDSARGTIDGDRLPGLDDAGDIPPPRSNTDEWVRTAEPGTKIPPEHIRSTGYSPEQAAALRDVAARNDAILGTRITNPKSTRWIESGTGVPKPVWMKPKTISELDELLGGPSRSMEGTVGFYEPRLPPNADAALRARYQSRLAEYQKLRSTISELESTGTVRVIDGVVHKVESVDPLKTRPFAGDIDAVVMLDAKTGAPIRGERYDRIVNDLRDSGVQAQHGAEANLVGDIEAITDGKLRSEGLRPGDVEYHRRLNEARADARALLDNLDSGHVSGDEVTVWSGADGHTVGHRLEELQGWHERNRGRFTDAERHRGVRGRGPGRDDDDGAGPVGT